MNEKRRSIMLITIALAISLAVTLIAVYLYRNIDASTIGNRLIQNIAYLLILLTTLIFMKISGKSLWEFGLFKNHIPRQIVIGIVIAIIFLAVPFLAGLRPELKEGFLYILLSQMLVAFSEELLFRGFVLTMLKVVVPSTNMAVLVSAVLFGLWHYPLGQNAGQVFSAFVVGAIYGALRTAFEDTDTIGVPSIAIAHWLYNVII